MKKRLKKKLQKKNKKTFFEPRYFFLSKGDLQLYLKLETVEGVISDEARMNSDHITYLMAQDIRDEYGREYDLTVIFEEEYKNKNENSEFN